MATGSSLDVASLGAVIAVLIVSDVVLAVVIVLLRRRLNKEKPKSVSLDAGGIEESNNISDNPNATVSSTCAEPDTLSGIYDRLNNDDMGVTSVYQDLDSPYEMPQISSGTGSPKMENDSAAKTFCPFMEESNHDCKSLMG